MRRISEQSTEFTSFDQRLDYLHAISRAAYTITRMLKIRKSLGKSYSMEDYFKLSMEEAINAISEERGWK
jgi:predicted transcriptional regulator